jgi:hypothetical protein
MADYEINVLECDLFDTRLRTRHLEKSLLDAEGLKKHLAKLPDVADEGESFTVHVGPEPEEEAEAEAEAEEASA